MVVSQVLKPKLSKVILIQTNIYSFIYAFFPSRNAISTAGQAGHLDDLASFFKSSFFTKMLMQFSKNWEQISFMLNM